MLRVCGCLISCRNIVYKDSVKVELQQRVLGKGSEFSLAFVDCDLIMLIDYFG